MLLISWWLGNRGEAEKKGEKGGPVKKAFSSFLFSASQPSALGLYCPHSVCVLPFGYLSLKRSSQAHWNLCFINPLGTSQSNKIGKQNETSAVVHLTLRCIYLNYHTPLWPLKRSCSAHTAFNPTPIDVTVAVLLRSPSLKALCNTKQALSYEPYKMKNELHTSRIQLHKVNISIAKGNGEEGLDETRSKASRANIKLLDSCLAEDRAFCGLVWFLKELVLCGKSFPGEKQ